MKSPAEFPRIGRYQVVNRIASGGMAEVFLGRATGAMGFHRDVALKLIHANFTRDPDFVKMFIDEARIAMHLHHRNIVQVSDLVEIGDTYCIAMEYVHGVNLYELYERYADQNRWVEVPLALYIVAELCKGLHFAHTRTSPDGRPMGIVHRDISPQNVLLSFEGEVKITDFGIATAAERLHQTAAGIVKGKYAYMAPERLEERPIDGRVDVFAAGVLLYELLVGENPFAGNSAVETIEAVLGKEVEPPSQRGAPCGDALDDLVLRALDKDPAARFPSAQAMADALTEFAMETTFARRDMASGDSALAQTLAQLFPDRAGRPLEAADPSTIALPGIEASVDEDTLDPQTIRAGAPDETHRSDADDVDAPTVLRMSPIDSDPMLLGSTASSDAIDEVSADRTVAVTSPVETASAHEDYGPTLLSSSGDDPTLARPSASRDIPPRRPASGSNLRDMEPARAAPTLPRGPAQERYRAPEPQPAPSVAPPPPKLGLGAIAWALVGVAAVVGGLAVFLNQPPEPNEVSIHTEPSGATVFIDGARQAESTPLLARIRKDRVTLVLAKEGFAEFKRTFDLTPGQPLEIREKLAPKTGALVVIPSPDLAEVTVDGVGRGRGKVMVSGLPFGRDLEVQVSAPGYRTEQRVIRLSPEEPKRRLQLGLRKR